MSTIVLDGNPTQVELRPEMKELGDAFDDLEGTVFRADVKDESIRSQVIAVRQMVVRVLQKVGHA